MSLTPPLECITFPTPWRYDTVAMGTSKIIWQEDMTGGFTGFIDRISVSRGDNELGNDGTYVDFIVDGVLIERIKREISLNMPDRFSPEIVVRNQVKFIAHNGTWNTVNPTFECIIQGRMCRPKTT